MTDVTLCGVDEIFEQWHFFESYSADLPEGFRNGFDVDLEVILRRHLF